MNALGEISFPLRTPNNILSADSNYVQKIAAAQENSPEG